MHPYGSDPGLCAFGGDPDLWFRFETSGEAKRICGHCPVRRRCAQDALTLEATDGVWAGVRLPGTKFLDELDAARTLLRGVISGLEHQPESHRLHTLSMRDALQYHADLERAGA
jgi:WhiB family transcriptional regulator, redox-sensing transcriptional regulator